jgi:hypothetical protein
LGEEERLRLGALAAAVGQLEAALRDFARTLGGYRRELIAAGFPPDEALELCLELQRMAILSEPESEQG